MRLHRFSLLGLLACAVSAGAQVRPGIDVVLADSAHLIAHRRLGLLTNQTGVDAAGRRDIDVLIAGGYRVTALFSPEHGFRGLEDRPGLPDAVDSPGGLPIYSLYGGTPLSRLAPLPRLGVRLVVRQGSSARY